MKNLKKQKPSLASGVNNISTSNTCPVSALIDVDSFIPNGTVLSNCISA